MNKKYSYIILLNLLWVSILHAQMGSSFGPKKHGSLLGGNSANSKLGGLASPFQKMGGTSMGASSFKSSNSNSSSKSKNKSSSAGSSHSTTMGSAALSSKNSTSSTAANNTGVSSNSSAASSSSPKGVSSSKTTSLSDLKNVKRMRSYPGIGKSKTYSTLKGGTKYSYPGVHNVKWDIAKMKNHPQQNKLTK